MLFKEKYITIFELFWFNIILKVFKMCFYNKNSINKIIILNLNISRWCHCRDGSKEIIWLLYYQLVYLLQMMELLEYGSALLLVL